MGPAIGVFPCMETPPSAKLGADEASSKTALKSAI
jgi:hypothetical protein